MAKLDYALLAEYARVDPSGLLTVVGASFDHIRATNPSAGYQLAVAVRVLLEEGESSSPLEVVVRPPSGSFQIGFNGSAEAAADATALDGVIGVVATVGLMIPLAEHGRYTVAVTLGDGESRELAFAVEHVSGGGG